MTYRVVQWSVGTVGHHALRGVLESRDMELVGVYTHDPARAGKDAGELAGLDVHTGITATSDKDALLALKPDCVIYCSVGETRPKAAVADLVAILSSGANVVSSSMMDAIHPASVDTRVSGPVTAACTQGNSTIFTTGIDPGFSSDSMAMAALQMCRSVQTVRAQELFVYGYHTDAQWGVPYGFGQPEGAPAAILAPGMPTRFWGPMVRILADILDVELDGLTESVERVYADEAFDVPLGHMPKGSLVGVRFEVAGIVDGEPRLFADHVTRMHPDVGPQWPKPPSEFIGVHRLEIVGDPSLTLDLNFTERPGADHNDDALLGTAARLINAIPAVVAAEPGMVTPLDLRLGVGRNLLTPNA